MGWGVEGVTLEVFWGCGSPYSWRVLLALAYKGLPYVSHRLSFAAKDLQAPEFLAINPRGQVPAIRDGKFHLSESLAIMCYLDKVRPEPPLFANSATDCGLIWQRIMACVYYLEPHMTTFAGTIMAGELPDNQLVAEASARAVEKEFAKLEDLLIVNLFLAGERLSAADIAYYPVVQLLAIAARRQNAESVAGLLCRLDHHFPTLTAWCRRIEALPGFAQTNPPHWQS